MPSSRFARVTGLLTAVCATVGCAGGEAGRATSVGSTVAPARAGSARELAPSQVALPTVPAPTAPDRCAPGAVEVSVGPGRAGESDVLVVFVNAGGGTCEIDLGAAWAVAHEVEPSVRLAPGERAELWGVAAHGGECAPGRVWALQVNGAPLDVVLPADLPCPVVPTAFFPN